MKLKKMASVKGNEVPGFFETVIKAVTHNPNDQDKFPAIRRRVNIHDRKVSALRELGGEFRQEQSPKSDKKKPGNRFYLFSLNSTQHYCLLLQPPMIFI